MNDDKGPTKTKLGELAKNVKEEIKADVHETTEKVTKKKEEIKTEVKEATEKVSEKVKGIKRATKKFFHKEKQCAATNLIEEKQKKEEYEKKVIPRHVRMALGGTAGMSAQSVVQPLDLIKVRMQMSAVRNGTTVNVARAIFTKEGSHAMYNGLSAGLVRQAGYTTSRMGIYSMLFEAFTIEGKPPGLLMKAALSMTSSAFGAVVGNPADVALIRMTADGKLPPADRRNYRNVGHAFYRIMRDEGTFVYWRGVIPNMYKAVIVSGGRILSYAQTKEMLKNRMNMEEGIRLHSTAAGASSIITTVLSLPFDLTKNRLQAMKVVHGVPEYNGMGDVMNKVVKNEGFLALWKGFMPCFLRKGLHTIFMFVFLEQFIFLYKTHVM